MGLFRAVSTFVFIAAAAGPVAAQKVAPRDSVNRRTTVPADARPPKGMCRIWIDGVPANQQPAPTDCPTALKNRPTNGRVLFGDEFTDSAKTKPNDKDKLPPAAKGFTEVKPLPPIVRKRPPE